MSDERICSFFRPMKSQGMKEREIIVIEGATRRKAKATLMICPDCSGERFNVFFPEGIDHVHFQCCKCGVSFCDGCSENFPP